MSNTPSRFTGNAFGVESNPPHGVRLVSLELRLSENIYSEERIDELILALHSELEGVCAAMNTALRTQKDAPLFDDES